MSTETTDAKTIWILLPVIFIALVLGASLIDWNNLFESDSNEKPKKQNAVEKTKQIGAYTYSNTLIKPMYEEIEFEGNTFLNYTEITVTPGSTTPYFYGGSKRIKFFSSVNGNEDDTKKVTIYGSNGATGNITSNTSYGESVRFTTSKTVTFGVAVFK